MLNCRDLAHKHASDYIDHQLNWRVRTAVRLHLLLCNQCRRFIRQLRQVRAVLRQRENQQPINPHQTPTAPLTRSPSQVIQMEHLAAQLHDNFLRQQAQHHAQNPPSKDTPQQE